MNWVRKYTLLNGPKRFGRGKTPTSFPPLPPTYQRRAVAGEESSETFAGEPPCCGWTSTGRGASTRCSSTRTSPKTSNAWYCLGSGGFALVFFILFVWLFFFCLFVGSGFGAWWLPSSSLLRSVWVGQENPHNGRYQADVWCWSRKGSIFSAWFVSFDLFTFFFFLNLKKKCCSSIVNAVAGEGREQSLESWGIDFYYSAYILLVRWLFHGMICNGFTLRSSSNFPLCFVIRFS